MIRALGICPSFNEVIAAPLGLPKSRAFHVSLASILAYVGDLEDAVSKGASFPKEYGLSGNRWSFVLQIFEENAGARRIGNSRGRRFQGIVTIDAWDSVK